MLKRVIYVAASTAIIVFMMFGLLALSTNYNYCVGHDGQHYAGKDETKDSPVIDGPIDKPTSVNLFLYCGGNFVSENGDGITAISTVFLTVITFLLGFLAWEQVRTSRIQMRAYVFVANARVFNLDKASERFIQVETKNFGSIPAFNKRFWCGEHVREWPSTSPFSAPPEDLRISSEDVAPGRSSIMKIPVGELSEWEERELRDGRAGVYFWGKITYDDVFGDAHVTNICLVCEGEGLASGLMHATEEGNSTS